MILLDLESLKGYRGQGAKDILIDLVEDSEAVLELFIWLLHRQQILIDPPAELAHNVVESTKQQITDYIIGLSEQDLRKLLDFLIVQLSQN